MKNWIKNYDQLATTDLRKQALTIMNAAYNALDTEQVIKNLVCIKGNQLVIKGQSFDLGKFKHIKIIGFGKVSCKAAYALEAVLGSRIKEGVAVGVAPTSCELIQTYQGTHPLPSYQNVEIAESIVAISKNVTQDDLVLVVVSGGGSALLCWPKQECDQGQILYHRFLATGGDITELNTVRKHISLLKGGGLAKLLYPARVVGLIFSDIPGDRFELVASGPTFKDTTTVADAQNIIDKYQLGKFELTETPKDDKYFANVTNIPLLTNQDALAAMAHAAKKMGLLPEILSNAIYDEPEQVLKQLFGAKSTVALIGGEPRLRVTGQGSGGRNLNLAMHALSKIQPRQLFVSFASDGLDNCEAAGAIVDEQTSEKIRWRQLPLETYLKNFDGYNLFNTLDELIFTGPTEANVSDLIFLIKK